MKKTLISAIAALAAATSAFAGEDSTERFSQSGPAWHEFACGLPCFALVEASGLQSGDLNSADLVRIPTLAEMQALLDATSRLAERRGRAATGASER